MTITAGRTFDQVFSAWGGNDLGLVARYDLDGNALDSGGNHLDGTVVGPLPTADRFGSKNKAMLFDGYADRITLGNPAAFNFSGDFTLTLWAKASGNQPERYIIAKYDVEHSGSTNDYGFGTEDTTSLYGFVLGKGPAYQDLRASKTINDGAWHAMAMVFQNGSKLSLYLDGELAASRNVSKYTTFTNNIPLTLGGTSIGQGFGGALDDVRIFARALSPSEMKTLYTTDLQPPPPVNPPNPAELPAQSGVGIRKVWEAHWDGGLPAKNQSPVAMQRDSLGNLCVLASAENGSNLVDYAVLKYSPDGGLLWARRYGTTNGLTNVPRSMSLDTNDSIYVTGTSVTLKYSAAGDEVWTAPYSGRGVSVQGTNVYVAGFSESEFTTARLSIDGATIWTKGLEHPGAHEDVAESVVADPDGGVYVAGSYSIGNPNPSYRKVPILVSYSSDGETRFATPPLGEVRAGNRGVTVKRGDSGLLFVGYPVASFWNLFVFDSTGANLSHLGAPVASSAFTPFGLSARTTGAFQGRMVVTGTDYGGKNSLIPEAGGPGPGSLFPMGVNATGGVGYDVALTKDGYSYCAGAVSDGVQATDIAFLKSDPDGNIVWYGRYNGAADGADSGACILIAPSDDSFYVAGYSTGRLGGREVVLLKYSEFTRIQQTVQGMVLQFPGIPARQYKIQAATNFPDWADIGLGTVDADGLLKYIDTDAPNHPFRFYQTVSTPQ